MSRGEARRAGTRPPLWWFGVYGICGGLVATSLAVLFSKSVYGSWDPTAHVLPLVVLGVLVLAGCGVANVALTWFAALVGAARGTTGTGDTSPR